MERIIEKVLVDESFRAALFADPGKVCAPFDITESEFVELMGRALPNFDGELSRTETPAYRK